MPSLPSLPAIAIVEIFSHLTTFKDVQYFSSTNYAIYRILRDNKDVIYPRILMTDTRLNRGGIGFYNQAIELYYAHCAAKARHLQVFSPRTVLPTTVTDPQIDLFTVFIIMSNAKVVNSAAASLHQDLRTFLRTEFECGLFDAYSQEVFRYMLYRVWTMNIAGGSSNILPFEACEEQEHELEDALVNGVFVQYIIENPRCMMFGFPDVKRLGSMHRQYGYTLMDDEAKIYKVVVKQVVRVCHSRDLIMGGGLSGGLPLKFTCKAGECHGKGLKSGHDKSQCHGREEIMEPEVEKATTDVDEMEDYR